MWRFDGFVEERTKTEGIRSKRILYKIDRIEMRTERKQPLEVNERTQRRWTVFYRVALLLSIKQRATFQQPANSPRTSPDQM